VILDWLGREGISVEVRACFQGLIDFIQAGGPNVVPGCIEAIKGSGGELHALKVQRKGFPPVRSIFCYGPTGDKELTLLLGVPDRNLGFRNVAEALALSKKNQRVLVEDPVNRRCYERVGKKSSI
jgi:hypothetical protein